MRRCAWVVLLCALAVVLGGCSAPSSPGELPEPGLEPAGDGELHATGIFSYVDLEGGFWRIAQTDSASEAEDAPTVVVVVNADDLPETADSYAGRS